MLYFQFIKYFVLLFFLSFPLRKRDIFTITLILFPFARWLILSITPQGDIISIHVYFIHCINIIYTNNPPLRVTRPSFEISYLKFQMRWYMIWKTLNQCQLQLFRRLEAFMLLVPCKYNKVTFFVWVDYLHFI